MTAKITAPEIVEKYNISYQTLNHYTNLGLLTSDGRKGFKRLYLESEVKKRLERIRKLKDKGYTLRAMVDLFNSTKKKKR